LIFIIIKVNIVDSPFSSISVKYYIIIYHGKNIFAILLYNYFKKAFLETHYGKFILRKNYTFLWIIKKLVIIRALDS